MRNCLKSLAIVAVFVAASFVGTKGAAAATGTESVPMSGIGTVNVNMAGGSNLAVNTPLETYLLVPASNPGAPSAQELWDADLNQVGGPPASVYTVFCWSVTIASVQAQQTINTAGWKCGLVSVIDNAPASVNTLFSLAATGTLDTSNPTSCQWFIDPGTCETPVGANMFPNFDPYVGQSLTFDVLTNWCSFVAPPNYDIVGNLSNAMNGIGAVEIGCASTDPSFTVGDMAARTLASASASAATSRSVTFKARVQAGPNDCHVPYVKGRTLAKAGRVLRAANCKVGHVRYVKGGKEGRVRYQPLKVGTGRPRGYRVKLAVTR